MRILLAAYGSRGDVQPFVALGVGLKAAGHEVCLLSDQLFQSLIESYGLAFAPVAGNIQELLQGERSDIIQKGRNPLRLVRALRALGRMVGDSWAKDVQRVAGDVDLVVASGAGVWMGLAVAQRFNIPLVSAMLQPFAPTNAFPSPLIPPGRFPLPRGVNALSHRLIDQLLWMAMRQPINRVRTSLGLNPWGFRSPTPSMMEQRLPTIHGYSPLVVAPPLEWGDAINVTGYWFLDHPHSWRAPEYLERFLQSGPPPIYIGFGSMSDRDAATLTKLVVTATRLLGCRALISAGWAGLGAEELPHHICMIDNVPHDWLLPRVGAAIHHCGAGTTAAVARAGIVSVPVPFTADQPFWADRLWRLGVASPPIPRSKLSLDRLVAALDRILSDGQMAATAFRLGVAIRSEQGVDAAVKAILRAKGQRLDFSRAAVEASQG